jgi:HipA-like protein
MNVPNLFASFSHLFKSEDQEADITTPSEGVVTFRLLFKQTVIGYLVLQNGEWTYSYSDEFKAQEGLQPIIDFPDVDKIYRSEELFPFFAFRIPSLKRPQIKEIIQHDHVDSHDAAALLKHFGKKTIANPFLLETA